MTAFLFGALATQVQAGVDCVALGLSDPVQIAAVKARIARMDEAAMKQFMQGAAVCLDENTLVALGRAAGEFFDQNPRAYLQLIATGEPNDLTWLESLQFVPEKIHPDPVARIAVLARRADTLKANADLISSAKFRNIWRQFCVGIERLRTNIANQFPEPLVMTDPLAGLEFDLESVLIEPATPDWVLMTKYAHGSDLRVFAHAHGAKGELYLLISGFSFKFSPDGSAIEGIETDEGWVESVDVSDDRVEMLAPAGEILTSPRIPREIAVELCENAVERLSKVLKDGRLQRALDDRLRRDPDAGLAKPLRDAFAKTGLDVKRFREIVVPDASH